MRKQLSHMVAKVDETNKKIRKLSEVSNDRMSPEAKLARREQLDKKIVHIQSGIARLYPKVHPK